MRMELTLDCTDLEAAAAFWSAALHYRRTPTGAEGYVALAPPAGDGIPVTLQRVPEPKLTKNRLHLDLLVEDVEAEVSRLVHLGADRLEQHSEYGTTWWVLADPESNEFCVGRLPAQK
ncbi:MAG TPA: VOC family protein [Kribbella sp.]|nr:VOC family protein [Kribbella sp.]